MSVFLRFTPILALLFCTSWVQANEKQFGDYTIHYSAFKSDFLTAPIAKAYGITRSKTRAVLNITVTEKRDTGPAMPIEATVIGKAINVYQQRKPLELREIKEPDAVYYIGEFSIAHEERIRFEITASKQGKRIGTVKFDQQFFR